MLKHEKIFCNVPFNCFQFLSDRYTTCCCSFLNIEAQVLDLSIQAWDAWNHPNIVKLRESVLDGSFKYCKFCPRFINSSAMDLRREDHKPITCKFVE